MLRVSFSSLTAAQAAAHVLEAYGYSAEQLGRELVTDCPTLLALPAIEKMVGFREVERLDLGGSPVPAIGASSIPTGQRSGPSASEMRA